MALQEEKLKLTAEGDTRAITTGISDVTDSLGKLENALDGASSEGDRNEEVTQRQGVSMASLADTVIVARGVYDGLTATMGQAYNVASSLIGPFLEQERALDLLAAQTGASTEQLSQYQDIGRDLFNQNLGESIGDVYQALSQVERTTGTTGEVLQGLTRDALTLSKVFGKDITESTRAADVIMKTFGVTSEQAFDMLTFGLQQTGDPADDLLDTFNEYSGVFDRMGLSANQAMGLIIQGMRAGARNTDVLADALKEFDIRLNDGNASTRALFQSFDPLFWEDYTNGLADGADALAVAREMLMSIENPLDRAQAGVALFGTKWEDFSFAIEEMDIRSISDDIDGMAGATSRAGAAMDSNLTGAWERFKRSVQTGFSSTFEDEITSGLNGISSTLDAFTWMLTPTVQAPDVSDLPTITEFYPGGSAGTVTFTVEPGDTPEIIARRLGVTTDQVTRALRQQGGFVSVAVDPDLSTFASLLQTDMGNALSIAENAGFTVSPAVNITPQMVLDEIARRGLTNDAYEAVQQEMQASAQAGRTVNLPTTINADVIGTIATASGRPYASVEAMLGEYVEGRDYNARLNVGAVVNVATIDQETGNPVNVADVIGSYRSQIETAEPAPVEINRPLVVGVALALAPFETAGLLPDGFDVGVYEGLQTALDHMFTGDSVVSFVAPPIDLAFEAINLVGIAEALSENMEAANFGAASGIILDALLPDFGPEAIAFWWEAAINVPFMTQINATTTALSGMMANMIQLPTTVSANPAQWINTVLINPIKTAISAAGNDIYNTFAAVINDAIPAEISLNLPSLDLGYGVNIGGGSFTLGPIPDPLPMRRLGGLFGANQPMIVGEDGPEIVGFGASGKVFNNTQSQAMMGGGQLYATIILPDMSVIYQGMVNYAQGQ